MNELCCLVSVTGRLNVNVALNRPSYQSSTHSPPGPPPLGPQPASRANDGNHNTWMNASSCMNTEHELNPWWAVDLGVPLYVSGVKFTNRGDGVSCTYAVFSLLKLKLHLFDLLRIVVDLL